MRKHESFPSEEPTPQEKSGLAEPQDVHFDEVAYQGGQQLSLVRRIGTRLVGDQAEGSVPVVPILGHLIPGAESCIIFSLDPVRHLLRPGAVANLSQEFVTALDVSEQGERLLTSAAEQMTSHLVIYLPGNRQFKSLRDIAHSEGIRTLWLVPWRDQDGDLRGVILFGSGRAFSPGKQALASAALLTELLSASPGEARPGLAVEQGRDVPGTAAPSSTEPDAVSVLSHELLSPLTLIKGYAATLLQLAEVITEEQSKQYLQGIQSATDRVIRLLENLRDISRLELAVPSLLVQPTSLPDLLRSVVFEVQSQTAKHVVKLRTHGPLPQVNVDREKIEQVVTNLLVNAVKYSPKGGDIEVAVWQAQNERELPEPVGRIPPLKSPSLVVSVTDSGIGIPEPELERIFERFYRVDNRLTRATSGAGLGLHICKLIVEAHRGHIWARSGAGEGSTLSFSIPVD